MKKIFSVFLIISLFFISGCGTLSEEPGKGKGVWNTVMFAAVIGGLYLLGREELDD